jgi:dipeptidyl aminopeptidase/acylaminoacyl peptidase
VSSADVRDRLVDQLLSVASCWGAVLSPTGDLVAYISDRTGYPQLWVQPSAADATAVLIDMGPDPVVQIDWSADGEWLACACAPGGGVRTQVWVVRPDGRDRRLVAGRDGRHGVLGPWSRTGADLVVADLPEQLGDDELCELVEPASGDRTLVARGKMVTVLDLSPDGCFALLRDGPRGARFCVVLDRVADAHHPLLPYPAIGSTDAGILRPAPGGGPEAVVAYLRSDAGRSMPGLLAVGVGADGLRGPVGLLAGRADAELEMFDADASGRLILVVWNVAGCSEVDIVDPETGTRLAVPNVPGLVINSVCVADHGDTAVFVIESPNAPRDVWLLDVNSLQWNRLTDSRPGDVDLSQVVMPSLERFISHDGLELTGWLYRAPDSSGPGPVLISLHGGPEAQERPGFAPQHQSVVHTGVSVFAPNVRGSSGFGRQFVHADDLHGRHGAIADVAWSARYLIASGIAAKDQIGCSGRSYGGYLTLAALVRYPYLFALGVDICGMSDLETFYRDTEPWIAAAAVSKYGDPVRDAALLADISPIRNLELLTSPLLVVHGELDTNVPLNEATQLVAALREMGRTVEFLLLEGEGHEYRRIDSRIRVAHHLTDFLRREFPTAVVPR